MTRRIGLPLLLRVPLLAAGMTVLVGVNGLNLAAFLAFAGDQIEGLPTSVEAVTDWCVAATLRQTA